LLSDSVTPPAGAPVVSVMVFFTLAVRSTVPATNACLSEPSSHVEIGTTW